MSKTSGLLFLQRNHNAKDRTAASSCGCSHARQRSSTLHCQVRQLSLSWTNFTRQLTLQSSQLSFPVIAQAHADDKGSNEVAELAATASSAQLATQQPAQVANEPKQYLYESRYGLPVVRKYLNYGELLRDIRTDKVERLSFFSQHETVSLEGPCLVVYKDGSVAQSYVPDFDYRVPYAAKNHAVATIRLPSEPIADTYSAKAIWSENTAKLVYRIVPLVAIGLVYAATQLAAKLKVCSYFCIQCLHCISNVVCKVQHPQVSQV